MRKGLKLGSFTVPVDVQRLRALRKAAGFPGRRAFAEELRRRGYAFNYNGVERGVQTVAYFLQYGAHTVIQGHLGPDSCHKIHLQSLEGRTVADAPLRC